MLVIECRPPNRKSLLNVHGMFHSFSSRFLLFLFFSLLSAASGLAYALEGSQWPDGSTVTMQLELGPTNAALQDGLQTWDGSAADALSLWNKELATIQFAWVKGSVVSKVSGDGFNSVFFSSSIFGDNFGEDVLAVTLYLTDERNMTNEADVLVNQAYNFNSYRGPLQAGADDIHRVFLHEFGHVIGLAHPDGPSNLQMVEAIMNSFISNLDHLAEDDIAGASLLYGLRFVGDDPINIKVGEPFSYKVTTNVAGASYQATGLPPGMTLDPQTGLMTGAATINGVYTTEITVDGPGAAIVQRLIIVVLKNPAGDLRASFPLAANRLLLDAGRSRVYASLVESKSIAVIDAKTLLLVRTIPMRSEPAGLALSPDGKKLYVAEQGTVDPEIGVLDLNSLDALPSLPAPAASIDVEVGLSNRLYVTTPLTPLSTGIFQLDATTGALLAPFPDAIPSGNLEVSPDRTRLYLASFDQSHSLYLFDIALESPVTLQTSVDRGQSLTDLKLSHDGSFLCLADRLAAEVPKIPAGDLEGTIGTFSLAGTAWARIAFSPDDQTFFTVGTDYYFSQIDTYNVTTTKFVRSLQGDSLNISDMVVDASGQYLFVSSLDTPELEILSTGSGTPTHPAKAKRLLNVSTRLAAGIDENVLIGGFILSGSGSKQVAIRAIGPSLPVAGKLANPTVALYNQAGQLVDTNDNWNANRAAVLFTGLSPKDEHESVLIATLKPGTYTAVVQGVAGGSGVALVEIYDLTPDDGVSLANISTRGRVETADNVMIGGFIISPEDTTTVLLRAIGPSLGESGIADPLQDPVLELHGSNGDLIFENDDWRSTQQAEILATMIPPANNKESAIVASLAPGSYTAIVRGQNSTSGVALVEVYNLDVGSSATKLTATP